MKKKSRDLIIEVIFLKFSKCRGTSEIHPKEGVFEDEQGLLKKVYETKSGLLEGRWIVQNKQSFSQPSFISTNVMDGEVSVVFDN